MNEFSNVSVVVKANIYFDGNVVSRTIKFPDGSKKTLGFMQRGEYTFDTGAPELMEIISGSLDILLPGDEHWIRISGGESFRVPGNAKFTMKVIEPSDYCCSFIS